MCASWPTAMNTSCFSFLEHMFPTMHDLTKTEQLFQKAAPYPAHGVLDDKIFRKNWTVFLATFP